MTTDDGAFADRGVRSGEFVVPTPCLALMPCGFCGAVGCTVTAMTPAGRLYGWCDMVHAAAGGLRPPLSPNATPAAKKARTRP